MLYAIKQKVRAFIPRWLLGFYHGLWAWAAALRYGFPSRSMIVIGVTGTKGKSTTSYLIAKIFEAAGKKVGLTSTAVFKIADREWVNDQKMTMLGRFKLQKLLAEMREAGCVVAVVETSSEGIAQNRHRGISYDMALLTNLTPEHLEAHGGFENYRRAKLQLFYLLHRLPVKILQEKEIEKAAGVNVDSDYADDFLTASSGIRRYGWTVKNGVSEYADHVFSAENVHCHAGGCDFTVENHSFHLPIWGEFNVANAMGALTVARHFGVSWEAIAAGLLRVSAMPGRMERIDEGQDFTVLVDYAHEMASTENLYTAVRALSPQRIIHVTGSAGGGRDHDRREKLGVFAGQNADVVIVTNEDPYDEDPRAIMEAVAHGAEKAGKVREKDLWIVEDRQKAIEKSLELAQKGDCVLITGKGSEQAMVVAGGQRIPWDDRKVAHEALQKRLLTSQK